MDESDEVLAEASRCGDRRAFEELVGRYDRVIYTLALRMVGNVEDARDLAQGVFVKAYRGLGSFDPKRRFFSWIFRIAVHQCLNHRRTSGRTTAMETEPEAPDPGPERLAELHEMEAGVQRALERLSEGDRLVIVMRHFMDCTYQDIGDALHVPVKTVKSRLFSARQRLRAELEKGGWRA